MRSVSHPPPPRPSPSHETARPGGRQRSNRRRTLWYTALEVAALSGLGALNVWAVAGFFKGAGRYGGKICV